MHPVIPRRIVPSVRPAPLEPEQVRREFRRVSEDGSLLLPAGTARRSPRRLLSLGYTPKYKLELFGVRYYLCDVRQNRDIRFLVAYVVLPEGAPSGPGPYPRLFYKDGSLLWRAASHYARSERENWIGKGDVRIVTEHGRRFIESAEHTTDLPFEIQDAVEELSRSAPRVRCDDAALALVVRRAADGRLVAFRDFTEPRRRAGSNPRNRIHGGRPIACFRRRNDPGSLRFAPGFEPDLVRGRLGVSFSTSRLYGGRIARHRIVSNNREVQYLFFAGPRHVWIGHPQPTTTELSSYGVRTVDVRVPDDLVVPGMEYHYFEHEEPPVLMSQIPPGFAGAVSPVDPWRADASAWLERLPVIQEFRRRVLARSVRGQG
jgi:hypothetical protein